MKNVLLFIAVVIPFFAAYTQPNLIYAGHINQAELYCIAGQYQPALAHFDSAFACERLIFGKDLYNALLCASRTGNNAKAGNYFEQLLRKGYPADSIGLNKQFATFVQSKPYEKLLKRWRAGLLPADNTIITPLQLLMDTLHKDDQYFRSRNPSDYLNHEYGSIILQIDSINAYKLIAAIKQYGFPNEFNCGIGTWLNTFAYIVITHQGFGSPTRQVDFAPYLLTAIKNRQVLPNVGLGLYARVAGGDSFFGIDCFFRVKQKSGGYKYAYYPSYSQELETKFNKNRAAYGLEPLADYRKKILYWLKNKDFAFDFKEGIQTTTLNEEVVPYLKGLTYIE